MPNNINKYNKFIHLPIRIIHDNNIFTINFNSFIETCISHIANVP
jgi:hypothetical protein